MKKRHYMLMAIVAMAALMGCNSKDQKRPSADFVDDVQVALADSGRIPLNNLQWTREPAAFEFRGDTIAITTAPHTDLWQRTYYHFQNDNAPVLQLKTRERFFSFVVKTDFTQSHHRFDQCGIVMYLDSDNWLKGSVEYENEAFQHLGSVVTNHGYSDWATTAIAADVKTMWYRFSRRDDDYCIECSTDGAESSQPHGCCCRRDSFRHLCLFARGLFVYRPVHRHAHYRVRLESPRRPATRPANPVTPVSNQTFSYEDHYHYRRRPA